MDIIFQIKILVFNPQLNSSTAFLLFTCFYKIIATSRAGLEKNRIALGGARGQSVNVHLADCFECWPVPG